jgi:hypothetical protein
VSARTVGISDPDSPPCTRGPERLDERRDPLALHLPVRPVEDSRTDDALGLESFVLGLLSLQDLVERVRVREGSPFVILRRMRVHADDASFEVDVAPLELQDVARMRQPVM